MGVADETAVVVSDELPPDPAPSVNMGAMATHELFVSYVKAGFTEHQALYLIALMLKPWPPHPGK